MFLSQFQKIAPKLKKTKTKKTAEAILIDFLYSHDIIDIEKGRAANTPM